VTTSVRGKSASRSVAALGFTARDPNAWTLDLSSAA
jgi:hypothetical protein